MLDNAADMQDKMAFLMSLQNAINARKSEFKVWTDLTDCIS